MEVTVKRSSAIRCASVFIPRPPAPRRGRSTASRGRRRSRSRTFPRLPSPPCRSPRRSTAACGTDHPCSRRRSRPGSGGPSDLHPLSVLVVLDGGAAVVRSAEVVERTGPLDIRLLALVEQTAGVVQDAVRVAHPEPAPVPEIVRQAHQVLIGRPARAGRTHPAVLAGRALQVVDVDDPGVRRGLFPPHVLDENLCDHVSFLSSSRTDKDTGTHGPKPAHPRTPAGQALLWRATDTPEAS